MLERFALGIIVAITFAAPAVAFNPQPDLPGKHPESEMVLADGERVQIGPDGHHITVLKGGKPTLLRAGEYKLQNGTTIVVGPMGAFKTINIGSQSSGAGAGK